MKDENYDGRKMTINHIYSIVNPANRNCSLVETKNTHMYPAKREERLFVLNFKYFLFMRGLALISKCTFNTGHV